MTTYDVGEIISYRGHDWLIDKISYLRLEVIALTKKRYDHKKPDGFIGWRAVFYVHKDDGHII